MPLYRIYRMKDSPRQQFRWAPHVSGCASVKPKDYDQRGEIVALNEYDAWKSLRESGEALAVGDLLEAEAGHLSVCKYVGFEPAQWLLPESKAAEGAAASDTPAPAKPVAESLST